MPINKRDIIILSADMWTPEEMKNIQNTLQLTFPLYQFMVINRLISTVSARELKKILREQVQSIEAFEKAKWNVAKRELIK